ncbi:Uncharacterised protein [uncultured archaeon]|nr:Uncharacterised protein [uncultured archaeon]
MTTTEVQYLPLHFTCEGSEKLFIRKEQYDANPKFQNRIPRSVENFKKWVDPVLSGADLGAITCENKSDLNDFISELEYYDLLKTISNENIIGVSINSNFHKTLVKISNKLSKFYDTKTSTMKSKYANKKIMMNIYILMLKMRFPEDESLNSVNLDTILKMLNGGLVQDLMLLNFKTHNLVYEVAYLFVNVFIDKNTSLLNFDFSPSLEVLVDSTALENLFRSVSRGKAPNMKRNLSKK